MEVKGKQTIRAGRQDVWRYLMDPAVLSRCIPGCKSLQKISGDRYALEIQLGIASIKGNYQGEVEIKEPHEPTDYTLVISAEGPPGFINATLPIALAEDGEATALTYEGQAEVGGTIAGVGQRVLSGVGKLIAKQFFDALTRQVTREANA